MRLYLATLVGCLVGVLVTLGTGLVESTPAQLVGATWYGYPLAWLRRLVLAPGYYPWRFDVINLVLDVIFWALVSIAILFVALRIRGTSGIRHQG